MVEVEKIYIVTDLGPGDGGKGGVVHKIATVTKAHTIVKFGGAQGQHGVVTSRGERFAFSQWGCGSLEGKRTHISPWMIISPVGLLKEAESLKYLAGIHDAFDLLTVDERALCATVYHGIASRLKEMARGNNPRGTIGTGVGEAYRYWVRYPELTIKASDLLHPDLSEKLAAVREQVRWDLSEIIKGEFLANDREEAENEIRLLFDEDFFEYAVERLQEAGRKTKIVDPDYFEKKILSRPGKIVVESSHGILTDHLHGFYPHVSAIRTLPYYTHVMLQEAGYNGQIVNIGVSRAYQIRHGAGPMPTEDPSLAQELLPGSHKIENRYQGKVRVGPLDIVLLRYAIEVCGGPSAFDGLAITWFDQIKKNGQWHICDSYLNKLNYKFFTSQGAIKVHHGEGDEQHKYQEALGNLLKQVTPKISTYHIPPTAKQEDIYSLCADVLEKKVAIPIRMVSFGPTERDKICK